MRFEESMVPLFCRGTCLWFDGHKLQIPCSSPLFLFFLFLLSFQPPVGKRLSFYPSGPLSFPLFPGVSSKGQGGGSEQGVFSAGRAEAQAAGV